MNTKKKSGLWVMLILGAVLTGVGLWGIINNAEKYAFHIIIIMLGGISIISMSLRRLGIIK